MIPWNKKILEAFHNDYVEGVANANVGFAETTELKLINHIYGSFGTINYREMEDATNAIVTPYDPSNPIIKFFVDIEKGVWITNASNTPFKNAKIGAKSFPLVKKDWTIQWTFKGLGSPSSSKKYMS